jgi:hypothetical protein
VRELGAVRENARLGLRRGDDEYRQAAGTVFKSSQAGKFVRAEIGIHARAE